MDNRSLDTDFNRYNPMRTMKAVETIKQYQRQGSKIDVMFHERLEYLVRITKDRFLYRYLPYTHQSSRDLREYWNGSKVRRVEC